MEIFVSTNTFFNVNGMTEGSNILPSNTVLRLKRDKDCRPVRFKSRLVSKENIQSSVDSLDDLYGPVVSTELVRTLLQVTQTQNWSIRHLDIKGAILLACLPEMDKIHVKLPTLPHHEKLPGKIVELQKFLYGLRRTSTLSYELFHQNLKIVLFCTSMSSHWLFFPNEVIIMAYVCDLLVLVIKSKFSG